MSFWHARIYTHTLTGKHKRKTHTYTSWSVLPQQKCIIQWLEREADYVYRLSLLHFWESCDACGSSGQEMIHLLWNSDVRYRVRNSPSGLPVGRRPLTTEYPVHSHTSPCGICGGKSGNWDRFFSRVLWFSFVSITPVTLHILSSICYRRCVI